MKPDIGRFLDVAAAYLMMQLAPSLQAYDRSNVTVLGAMLMAVNEELDRAASRRVEENQALRCLFREAVPVVADTGLRARLEDAASGNEASLAVSDLERDNAQLRGLLIELHACVEGIDAPEARRVEAAIWKELAASTQRRRLAMGPF